MEKTKLPPFLPHGWKTNVSDKLKIHPITIRRNLKKGYGGMYDLIIKTAVEIYGKQNGEKL